MMSPDNFEMKFCATSTDQACEEKMPSMHYKCDACGGLWPDAEHLCNPTEI